MGKILKSGRIVVLLQGRHAGKKAVVVKTSEEGTKSRPFGHALVIGVERAPLKITKRMSKRKQTKRSRVKPFMQLVNFNHVMPTRYHIASEVLDTKAIVAERNLSTKEDKTEILNLAKQALKKAFATEAAKNRDVGFLKAKLRF